MAERRGWGGTAAQEMRKTSSSHLQGSLQTTSQLGSTDTSPCHPLAHRTSHLHHHHRFMGERALHCTCTQVNNSNQGEKRQTPFSPPDIQPDLPANLSASAALALQLPAWSGRRWKGSPPGSPALTPLPGGWATPPQPTPRAGRVIVLYRCSASAPGCSLLAFSLHGNA